MSKTRKLLCPHCADEGPHTLHERDGDKTEWWLCRNKDCPIGHFSVMSRRFVRELRQSAGRVKY